MWGLNTRKAWVGGKMDSHMWPCVSQGDAQDTWCHRVAILQPSISSTMSGPAVEGLELEGGLSALTSQLTKVKSVNVVFALIS